MEKSMKIIFQAVVFFIVISTISGIFYPLVITALGQLLWHHKSNGSLIKEGNMVIGSELIAQKFSNEKYFFPRFSASDFNALPGSASNLGPTSARHSLLIQERRKSQSKFYHVPEKNIPSDLLTTSASGLDPHISIQSAKLQLERVAENRALSEQEKNKVADLIKKLSQGFWIKNDRTKIVNVLLLNLSVDKCCRHD